MHTLLNAKRGNILINAIRGNILRQIGCFLFVSICLPLVLNAQSPSLTVSGKVTDNKKSPLPGVSVVLKGTARGTTTNADGWYQLADIPEKGVLIFSYTGFEAIEIPVKGKGTVDIALTEVVSSLNEVVVTGYGTSKRKDLTGAIAQVKGPRFENENPRSVQDMLRGNAAEFLQFRADAMWAKASFDSISKPGIQYLYTDPSKLPSNFTVAQWLALDGSGALNPVDVWFQRDLFKPIELANYKAGQSLDWEKLIYNENALQHDHTLSIAQKRDDYNYYFSLGYLTNEGLTVGDKYTTYRTRLNLEAKAAS